ncbi:hypothetical protein H5T89_05280 [bacterium]|nr:hypothetical protein [bacterium]
MEYRDIFPDEVREELPKIAEISKYLRKEREFALYGDIDFIPTEEYNKDAEFVVKTAEKLIV